MPLLYARPVFQFHKGTIRTALSATLQNTLANFNSIKVRLEQALQALPLMAITFQFHKGTIRTYLRFFQKGFDAISIP